MRRLRASRSLVAAVVALACPTLVAGAALALKQPNDVQIPVGSGLQDLFASRGEKLDALADAQAMPETFTPTCKLSFEVLQRNAGYKNAFGWYNVTGKKPELSELHEFLSCNDPVGTKKILSIKKDPAYLGGDVGFFEATGGCGSVQSHDAIFFSEKKYNPDGNQQNPFIHLLIYNSTVVPKAFYFGWEDLLSGGDNDFDDLTTFVSGIGCTGSGGKCMTGKLGMCGEGTQQCQNGALACLPLYTPTSEVCDGLDNDCSGVVDEGNLCPDAQVCDKGTCVPKCDGGEFACPRDKVCDVKGLCVDPGCLQITCPEDTRCDGGKCVGPCDGVTCPFGQVCLAGACFDPCSKFTCDAEQVCVAGACVERCDCAGCPKGQQCQADGKCIPDACVNKACAPGTHCDASGDCIDDCLGAVCPDGQACVAGACVPSSGQGGAGGADVSSSTGFDVGGGAPVGSASAASGSGGGGAGLPRSDSSGCGCRVGGDEPSERAVLTGLGIAGALAFRRGRRRRGQGR